MYIHIHRAHVHFTVEKLASLQPPGHPFLLHYHQPKPFHAPHTTFISHIIIVMLLSLSLSDGRILNFPVKISLQTTNYPSIFKHKKKTTSFSSFFLIHSFPSRRRSRMVQHIFFIASWTHVVIGVFVFSLLYLYTYLLLHSSCVLIFLYIRFRNAYVCSSSLQLKEYSRNR